MNIFGSNCFSASVKESSSYGAWIASRGIFKHLLKYGSFDEYHFFILNKAAADQRSLKNEIAQYRDEKRIKFIEKNKLPEYLRETDYTIFFQPDTTIYGLVNLRTTYAKKYYPVCGITYTISYGAVLHEVLLNIISDLQPFDATICISEATRDSFKEIYNRVECVASQSVPDKKDYKMRFEYLPLGIDSENYGKTDKKEARNALGLPDDKVIILHFGRFSIFDKADLQPLLAAFKHLLPLHDNILLVLAGSNFQSKYDKRVRQIADEMGISNHVRFFLKPSLEDKYKLYSAGDIFVSISDNLQESFGQTVLEASASGLPAVVSHWDGYKDLVVHNETGFHIPTYWSNCDEEVLPISLIMGDDVFPEQLALAQSVCVDPKKMIEYLSALIGNPELRRKFGDEGRRRVQSVYDWSVVIPRYEDLWLSLSEMAKKSGDVLRKPALHPKFFDCFRNYPTLILDADTKVCLTEDGIGLLKTKKLPSGQPPFNILTPHMVFLILFFLYDKKEASIGEITAHVQNLMVDTGSAKINYQIMWMLKKYLLEKI